MVDLEIISALKIGDLNLATKIGKFLIKNILAKVHRAGIPVTGIKMLPTVLAVLTVGTAVLAETAAMILTAKVTETIITAATIETLVLTANGMRRKLRKV